MYIVEMTDTFGGEANYSWVRRETIEADSHKQAITIFKKFYGIGKHKKNYDLGDMVRVDVVGACVCIFSHWSN